MNPHGWLYIYNGKVTMALSESHNSPRLAPFSSAWAMTCSISACSSWSYFLASPLADL